MRFTMFCQSVSNMWIFTLFTMGPFIWPVATTPTEEEYCHYDYFNPNCDIDEVLVIHRAQYGRMTIGKCVKTNFGYVGCFTDVLYILDRNCSGRRSCSIKVEDPSFGGAVPCNDEFKNYLQVSYNCVKVPNINASTCRLQLRDHTKEVIPVGSQRMAPCGTNTRPLRVEAKKGQTIEVTLLDFNPRRSKTSATTPHIIDMHPICNRYGLIFDGEPKDDIALHIRPESRDICQGQVRESLVMSSTSSTLLLQFSSDKSSNFALRFTVIGCPELKEPKDGWIKKEKHNASVKLGCNHTKRIWHVVCQDNKWAGDMVNCSSPGGNLPAKGGQYNPFNLSTAWTSLVALGVAIIIGLVILIVGLFCWRRYTLRRKERSPRMKTTDNTPMYQIASTQNLDTSDGELDLLTHTSEQRTPCLYCRAANEHYAPFREAEKTIILPRQSIYSSRTFERPTMPPDLYSCNIKNKDEEERIKILSDLNVAYDRLPQTLPRIQSNPSSHNTLKSKDREHKVLKDI